MRDQVLFPNDKDVSYTSNRHVYYKMTGKNANSKTLEFPSIRLRHLQWYAENFNNGLNFKLWYGEDYKGYTEGDNSGTSCADVYAKFQGMYVNIDSFFIRTPD